MTAGPGRRCQTLAEPGHFRRPAGLTARVKARARTAAGEERARLWQEALKFWPPYADYQGKTEREIPVVVLDPVN